MQLRIYKLDIGQMIENIELWFLRQCVNHCNKSDNYMLGVSYCKFKCYCSRKTSKPKNLISQHTITAKT